MQIIMLTKIISLKEYRQKITSLWKEANEKNIRYIVLHHSKPILDVKPYAGTEVVFDSSQEEQKDYYQTLEQNLDFWNNSKDDNIFKA